MSQAFDYLNDGDTIAFTAPTGGVTAWSGYVIGKLFLVAMQTALAGVVVSGRTKGVFSLPKVSAEVWTEGMAIYWDTNQNKARAYGARDRLRAPLGARDHAGRQSHHQGFL